MATTELDRMVVRLVGDTKQYTTSMKEAGKTTEKFTRDAQGRLRDMRGKFVTDQQLMRAQLDATSSKFKKFGILMGASLGSLKTLGASMTSLGRTLMFRLTLPLTLFGGFAVRAFAKFDQAMVESTSIMKVTEDQIKRMRATAISLSGESAKSATNLAESYFFLASAGKDAEQSMSLLPKVADFAIAGAFDMALATDLLTDAQSALGLSSKDIVQDTKNLVRVSDVLVKANTLANASVQQFATALTSKAGASMKAFGKDVEEGVAVLAAFADQGVKAELAGNQLDRVIRLLSKSSMDNAKAHKRLGFAVFDDAGKMRNLGDVVGNLEDILAGMSDETKVATLSMLGFEARVQQAILPLLGTSKAIKKYEQELRKAKGITQEVANKQMRSFANQMKVAWNRVKTFASSIGEQLSPMLLVLGNEVRRVTETWSNYSDATKGAIVKTGLIVAAIPPLLILLGSLATAIATVKIAFLALKASIGLKAMAAFGVTIGVVVAGALVVVNKLVTALGNLAAARADLAGRGDKTGDRSGQRRELLAGLGGQRGRDEIARSIEAQKRQVFAARDALASAPDLGVRAKVAKGLFGADPVEPLRQGLIEAQNELKKLEELQKANDKAFFRNLGGREAREAQIASQQVSDLLAASERLAIQEELDSKATTLLDTLKLQQQTVGMTAREAQIFGLEQKGVNDTLIEQLRLQDRLLMGKEAEKKAADELIKKEEKKVDSAKNAIDKLLKIHRDPAEQLKRGLQGLEFLVTKGLPEEVAKKQANKLFRDFQKGEGVSGPGRPSVSRGVQVGSREFFELAAKGKGGAKDTPEKTLLTLEEIRDIMLAEEKAEAANLAGAGA